MTTFRYTCTIPVRYSDIDAQGHVNNARYFTYMEEARIGYFVALGLWREGHDFNTLGQIVAEATCTYKRPILLGQTVQVATRTARIGTKSLTLEYRLLVNNEEVATGRSVQVAYDYATQTSIPILAEWRAAVAEFEGTAF